MLSDPNLFSGLETTTSYPHFWKASLILDREVQGHFGSGIKQPQQLLLTECGTHFSSFRSPSNLTTNLSEAAVIPKDIPVTRLREGKKLFSQISRPRLCACNLSWSAGDPLSTNPSPPSKVPFPLPRIERNNQEPGETRQTASTSAHWWERNCSPKEEGGS